MTRTKTFARALDFQKLTQHRELCCGCEACVQVCSRRCISFEEDDEGFRYPRVNASECVDCGLCSQVCPIQNVPQTVSPKGGFAYQSANQEVLFSSSSGGLFTALANQCLRQGGRVFGARFNERWEVEHTGVDTLQGVEALRTSKYVQSRVGQTFREVADTLSKGIPVLFCGTPCQVAALQRYLRKNKELLTCVDFVCHGVPSPLVWRKWLSAVFAGRKISAVNFRSKPEGWNNYHLEVRLESGEVFSYAIPDSAYTKAFSANIMLRPSCYRCQMHGEHHSSDLTMADFWGVEHVKDVADMADNRGVSLAIAQTEKGANLLKEIGARTLNQPVKVLMVHNPSYSHQTPTTALRSAFFSYALKHPEMMIERLEQLTHLSPMRRRYYKICTFVRKMIGMI